VTGLALTENQRLEAVGPGAAAHMSLHQNHDVKERKTPTPWLTLFLEGDPGAWFLVTGEAFR
jgi:hypothetical protein